jgi:hypothetical protein
MIMLLITAGGDEQASARAKEAETRLMAELLDAVGWRTTAGGKIMADDVGLMVSDDRQILDICAGGIDPPHIERRTEQFRTVRSSSRDWLWSAEIRSPATEAVANLS